MTGFHNANIKSAEFILYLIFLDQLSLFLCMDAKKIAYKGR